MTPQPPPSPWDRLQDVLLALEPDQTITVDEIVAETELSPETVFMVLDGLTKAGLFVRHGPGLRPTEPFSRANRAGRRRLNAPQPRIRISTRRFLARPSLV